jgi:hypothetical protein
MSMRIIRLLKIFTSIDFIRTLKLEDEPVKLNIFVDNSVPIHMETYERV